MNYVYKYMNSPVGKLKLVVNERALVAILWENDLDTRVKLSSMTQQDRNPILCRTEKQLKEYFDGMRTQFDLPLEPMGTDFQQKVWQALRQIPFGVTRSYGEIAKAIASPKASRAVGAANGKNPISIIVPCHRVIGSNGKLTGFAGGLKAKEILLHLERKSKGGVDVAQNETML